MREFALVRCYYKWIFLYDKENHQSVGGIVVSIAAFQAVDPGSIPGRRNHFLFSNGTTMETESWDLVLFSWRRLGVFLLPPLEGMLVHDKVTSDPSIKFTSTHLPTFLKKGPVREKHLNINRFHQVQRLNAHNWRRCWKLHWNSMPKSCFALALRITKF